MHRVIGRCPGRVRASASAVPVIHVMGLHKLTAGDGYSYLTRHVAAHDATEKGHQSLGDYYDEQGESPGRWVGSGLSGMSMAPGSAVTAEQMKALFGQGRHPDAVALEAAAVAEGADPRVAAAAGALGRPFHVYEAASVFNTQVARAFTDYNRERGLTWNAAIPVEVRARIRTEVGTSMFTEQHGRGPENARELSGFVARASHHATSAVAGYDLTFSPVKSVSTLWALAPREVAEQVRAAHHAAVEDTIGWLEREAVFTRVGRGGARQVTTVGLVAAMFTHRDTRAGDPDLHTHVAISNKVQTVPHPSDRDGGRWLALDGRLIYQANVAASERYNTRLEAELTARLGLGFHDTQTSTGKRPVREIDGINSLLTRWWSRRRRDIEVRRSVLAAQFQTRHGRPPTAVEAIALAQQATLETRAAKHATRSEAQQRATWRYEAEEALGGPLEVDDMLNRALGGRRRVARPDSQWCHDAARDTVEVMEDGRATWQVWHLRAEAERQARTAGIGLAHLDHAVDQVVEEAIALSTRLGAPDPITEPAALRRADGTSVYEVHGATRYTSTRILAAEQEILALAQATGGPWISDVRVQIALAESTANGLELNDAQAAMVTDLATSRKLLQLALAPAGTGKTTTMAVLSRAWAATGAQVLGLAPSAQAAQELAHALTPDSGAHTDTLTKLTWTLTHAPRDQWPAWVVAIGPRSLVIIDEAGQASTTELAAAVRFITGRGGIVRLIGDDQQLASVGAGGVLRDLTHTLGATTLSEVRRFTDHAEAAATLAIREGDPSALGFYADRRRIHVGDIGAVTDQAYDAWATDRSAGLDSILLAPTRDLVTLLNARARTDRIATLPPAAHSHQVRLTDGNNASAGDVIVTRRNDRRLAITATDWVKNGDRWTITDVHLDQSLTVRHHGLGCSLRLPGEYVTEHVQLGYAATVHAAQGMTTDTAHTVLSGQEPRQLLYVAISRGRRANHLYLANSHDGDPHTLIRPETMRPPTALDTLAGILERDGSQHSATTTKRDHDSPATGLYDAALRYHDALEYAAMQTLGDEQLTALDAQLEALWPGLTGEPAYPTLRGHLALHALDGTDPLTLLLDADQLRDLGSSADRAAVLDWRLSGRPAGPLPWLQAIPRNLEAQPVWGAYLRARADRVTALADAVHADALTWSPAEAPAWVADLTAERHAALRGDLAVWRAAFGIPETERHPTGPPHYGADAATHQHQLDRRLRTASRRGNVVATPLHGALPPAVQTDPSCDQLVDRLQALAYAGVSVADLLTETLATPRPLPEERTADALWWRIVGHLGPVALRTTGRQGPALRPPWVTALTARIGAGPAERVMADAAWPALVAAIGHRPAEWTAEELIDAVATNHEPGVPVEDLCSALVWRVATMTDPPDASEDHEEVEPPLPVAAPDEPPCPQVQATPVIAPTPVDRIVELNEMALERYTDMYPRSWAPAYLHERLGRHLDDEFPFTPGYAPPGPASLLHHLAHRGATEAELIDAGLARRTERGRLTDTFRDRLVFPIYAGPDLVGFVARRNPTKDDSPYVGPKYLNTRTTPAFHKGELLFGLTEGARALEAGATPVLVEGPLDALAVTLAARSTGCSDSRTVGIAPLGTAFTEAQAAHLKPLLRNDPSRVVIATDGDAAGWAAAHKAFWRLVALGADPRHLALPPGQDPADLLRTEGHSAFPRLLSTSSTFGEQLLSRMVADTDPIDTAARLWLARDAARVIAALPPVQWTGHIDRLNHQLDLPPGMLHLDVIDAAEAWAKDPHREAEHQLRRTAPQPSDPTCPRKLPAKHHGLTPPGPVRARIGDREAGTFQRQTGTAPTPRR